MQCSYKCSDVEVQWWRGCGPAMTWRWFQNHSMRRRSHCLPTCLVRQHFIFYWIWKAQKSPQIQTFHDAVFSDLLWGEDNTNVILCDVGARYEVNMIPPSLSATSVTLPSRLPGMSTSFSWYNLECSDECSDADAAWWRVGKYAMRWRWFQRHCMRRRSHYLPTC